MAHTPECDGAAREQILVRKLVQTSQGTFVHEHWDRRMLDVKAI